MGRGRYQRRHLLLDLDRLGLGGVRQIQADVTANNIRWIRLAADPASDDLLLAFVDDAEDTYTLDWSGSAWGTVRTIETDGYGNADNHRPFDIIFEAGPGHSGHALIAFQDGTSDYGYIRYMHTSDITGDWGAKTQLANWNYSAYWIQLARDDTNRIHLAAHTMSSPTFNEVVAYTRTNDSSWSSRSQVLLGCLYDANHTYEAFALTAMAAPAIGITALDYGWGYIGQTITITGKNFGDSQGAGTVKFNDNISATVISWRWDQIVVIVPTGAVDGNITITTDGGDSVSRAFDVITAAPPSPPSPPARGRTTAASSSACRGPISGPG